MERRPGVRSVGIATARAVMVVFVIPIAAAVSVLAAVGVLVAQRRSSRDSRHVAL